MSLLTVSSNPATVDAGVTISKVEYFQDTTLIASSTTAPYDATWNNVAAGSYNLTAKVTDSNNSSASSAPVAITVINNTAPTISVTVNPAAATAPATLIITATANDSDGSIAKVELFNGENLITTLNTAPYTYQWANVAEGSYDISAKATDNLGAVTTSSTVAVTVAAHQAQIYDIHTDHLGTPRMVTDASGNSVWEWIGTPFGESLPNQNPQNVAGKDFVMNLRFPGQVFDGETGLHYNYFRDYDPGTGRYVESYGGESAGANEYPSAPPIASNNPFGIEPGFVAGMGGGGSSSAFGAASAGATAAGAFGSTSNGGFSRAASTAANVIPVVRAVNLGWSAGTAIGAEIHRDYGDRMQPAFEWVFDHITRSTNWISGNTITKEEEKEADYQLYKGRCDEPPPPNLNKCENAKWQRDRAQQCKNERQSWDNKWQPGRHAEEIQNQANRVAKWEKVIARECKCP